MFVKEYQARGGDYKGKKNEQEGLNRWFDEKWTNQRGGSGYKYKSDVHRPTVKVNRNTPTTFKELTKEQIERATEEKRNKGRVNKFDT